MDETYPDRGLKRICDEIVKAVDEVTASSVLQFFFEKRICEEIICRQYFPFRNGGLLSTFMILRILLLKDRGLVLEAIKRGDKAFSEMEIRRMYKTMLSEKAWLLTGNEIISLSIAECFSCFSYGIISMFKDIEEVELVLGSCALIENNHDICRCGIRYGKGKTTFPDFLRFASKEEMIRVIRIFMLKEKQIEFTGQAPVYEDGEVYAIRPPYGEWGMKKHTKGKNNGENNSLF